MLQPVGRVLPEGLLEEGQREEGNIGGTHHAQPVDDRTTDSRRCETIGMADHPAGKHATAAATTDIQALFVDITGLKCRVDTPHKVEVVDAWIRTTDRL